MGLNTCCSTVKYLMVLINLLFWVIGLAIISCAIWMLTDPTFLFSMTQDNDHYVMGLYVFLAVGTLILIVAFLGCCGACKESQCMLVSFFCCLLIVLVAEIAAGAWAFHHREHLNEMVKKSVLHTVKEEYSLISSRTIAFDTFQKQLKCCGAESPADWATSRYNDHALGNRNEILNMVVSKKIIPNYRVPPSCCKDGLDETLCENGREIVLTSSFYSSIYEDGCAKKLLSIMEENWLILIGVMAGIILLEVFGLIFSLALCCAIKNDDYHKA